MLERERNTGVEHPLMRELDLPYPILVGRLDAGEWSSMVPDRLRFEGRVGVRVGEPPAEARAAVEQLAEGVAELTWEGWRVRERRDRRRPPADGARARRRD